MDVNNADTGLSTHPRGRKSKKWDDVNAIEYNAGTQSLSKVPKQYIKETTHTKIAIKRRGFSPGDRVNIEIPMEADSKDFSLCLAKVRMGSLPRDVFWQRIAGNVTTIYVKGVSRAISESPDVSRASSVISTA